MAMPDTLPETLGNPANPPEGFRNPSENPAEPPEKPVLNPSENPHGGPTPLRGGRGGPPPAVGLGEDEKTIAALLAERDALAARIERGEGIIVRRSGHAGAGQDPDWGKWSGLLDDYERVCTEIARREQACRAD